MPKNTPKNTKKRTQVKELPKAKKRLTKDEVKKIKGGLESLSISTPRFSYKQ